MLPAVVVYADATISMSTEFVMAQQEAFQEEAIDQDYAATTDDEDVADSDFSAPVSRRCLFCRAESERKGGPLMRSRVKNLLQMY